MRREADATALRVSNPGRVPVPAPAPGEVVRVRRTGKLAVVREVQPRVGKYVWIVLDQEDGTALRLDRREVAPVGVDIGRERLS